MKLSEFRKLIDEMDDKATQDLDIVLDIDPRQNGEHLIDIGEIYRSKIDESKIKIEPHIELFTENSLNNFIVEEKNLFKRKELRCPNCHNVINATDRHCKYCGYALYTTSMSKKALKQEARELRANAKVLRQRTREEKRALRVIRVQEHREKKKNKSK